MKTTFRVRLLAGPDQGVIDASLEADLPFVPTIEMGIHHPAFGEHEKKLAEVSYNLETEDFYAVFPDEHFSCADERGEMAAWYKDNGWTISH